MKHKNALRLMVALGTVSCGGSMQAGDAYQGFLDGTALDAKLLPSKSSYEPMKAVRAAGESVPVYSLGLIPSSDKVLGEDANGHPVLEASKVSVEAYTFPEGCKEGKEYDVRLDAYREDAQYPVFKSLPFASKSTVLPLVKVKAWTGVSQHTCNAIKSAKSLEDGVFGGQAAEGETVAMMPVIDGARRIFPLSASSTFGPSYGWYKGLQLAYLDGGELTVDGGIVKTMDGVWLKPSSSTAKATDSTAKLVLQAKPGDANWSPVVLLRQMADDGNTYTSLCYDPPCADGTIDMQGVNTYTGMLFLVGSAQ